MPDTDNAIASAITATTEPTPPDNSGLLATVAALRHQVAEAKINPKSPAFGNVEFIQKTERNITLALAGAGAVEPVFDPRTAAQDAHDERFTLHDLHPNLVAMLDERLDKLEEQHTEAGLTRMAAELREQTGFAEYDQLVREAQAALNVGEVLPKAMLADLTTLRTLAAQSRYRGHYLRTRPA